MPRRRAIFSHLLLAAVLFAVLLLSASPAMAVEGEEGEHGSASTEYLFKWINFFTVLVPAVYFGGPWLKREFAGIRQEIRSDIDEAQRQKSEAEARIAEVEQKLSRLAEETERLRAEAKAEMSAQLERIRAAAGQEADRLIHVAGVEIEAGRRAASIELRAYSAQLAVELAEEQLRKRLTPAAHTKLFESFVRDIAIAAGRS